MTRLVIKLPEFLEKEVKRREIMTEKMRNALTYTGWLLSGIFSIVYVIILCVMIFGFRVSITFQNALLMAILGAVFTFAITISMVYQGVLFAKDVDNNKNIMKEYYVLINRRKKEKKIKTINFYMIKQIITTLIVKGGVAFISTYTIINLVFNGIGDIMILWLGVANILVAIGLGFIGLVSSYDFYNEQHIPAIRVKIEKISEESKCQN